MAGENSSNGYHEYEDDEMSMYKKDANAVVAFNTVYDESDLVRSYSTFKPVMSHQIFGENESIFGYRSLTINLFYLHNSARCYVNILYSGELKNDLHKPDNIMECLNPWLPENYTTDKKEVINWIQNERHDILYGTVIHEYISKNTFNWDSDVEVECKYKITQCDLTNDDFKTFHSRFETLVIWYIDGANFIDLDDEKWEIFYVYEEIKHPETEKLYVTPIGFCTVYKFFAYPQNIRSRISQFFILPTHQRRGIGTVLYQTVFRVFQENSVVTDITVEEPTPAFQKIRDIYDCSVVQRSLKENGIKLRSTSTKKSFGIIRDLKLGKKQCQRVYDILCGCEALGSKDSFDGFLKNIYKRINTEVKDKMKGMKKMRHVDGEVLNTVMDQNALVEAEFKKYKEDLEKSVHYVKKGFKVNNM